MDSKQSVKQKHKKYNYPNLLTLKFFIANAITIMDMDHLNNEDAQSRIPVDPYCPALNLVPDKNDWGAGGEDFFAYVLRKYHFQVYFLGDKAPTKDFLVQFVVNDVYTYSFLVQVKTPMTAIYRNSDTTIDVPNFLQEDVIKFSNHSDPTYLCVVDLKAQKIYFRGIFGENATISSIETKFCIEDNDDFQVKNGQLLHEIAKDVIEYHQSCLFSQKNNFITKIK